MGKILRHVRLRKVILYILLLLFLFFISIFGICYLLGPPDLANEQNTIYYSDDEMVIGEESGSENRYEARISEISPDVINATIAVEDRNFFTHHGFDLKRVAGAIVADIKSLSLKEGASTLTQQYARNLFLTQEKTWLRKVKEAFYTIRLEMFYSKEEILEGYLNTIYFGHGAYGIEAASMHFFHKNANELTLAEAAMLAGIPKGPTYYSPLKDEERAKKRQERILSFMLEQGVISKDAYEEARNEELHYKQAGMTEQTETGPYFLDLVLRESANILDLDQESIKSGGYKVFTTLDVNQQEKLEEETVRNMDEEGDFEIGAMAMDPTDGGIKALVGGTSYEESSFNRAIDAKRMPGSTFKPILYYSALENGYTASTKLESKPTRFVLENDEIYEPSNFNGYYANEPITLAQALALSDNIYAVKTNLAIGEEKLVQTAKELGITSTLPEVPSLALGTATVSLDEMMTAYGRLANGKEKVNSRTVTKIIDKEGKVVYEYEADKTDSHLNEKSAFILSDLMTGMFDESLNDYTSVTGASISDELAHTYAGKSGTTASDSWMIGFSPELVTGIWTGYDDNRKLTNQEELTAAKKIWASFMNRAHEDMEVSDFTAPEGVTGVPIDPTSGQIATPYCESSRVMYYTNDTLPEQYCSVHFPDEQDEAKEKQKKDEKGFFRKLFDLFGG